MSKMSNLLEGINVVELGTHMAVPLATRILADWGANVIKVEPPKGEAWRTIARTYGVPFEPENNPVFQTPNANKRDITINLKTEQGKEVLFRLLERADVFITNTRMKSLEKMGIDYQSLKDRFPRLVYAHFSGYGTKGPDKDRPGFDLAAYWARAGMPIEWTVAGNTPFRPMPGFGDATVSPSLVSAVLAALAHRERTGRGDFIQTSLLACALWYNNMGVVSAQPKYGSHFPRSRYEQTAPYNVIFVSKDDRPFVFSIPNWNQASERLFRAMGLDECVGDPVFMTVEGCKTDMKRVVDTLEAAFRTMTLDEVAAMFRELDVVFQEVINPSRVTEDQQAWANDYLLRVTLECGDDVVLSANPLRFAEADTLPFRLAPQLGENNREILQELGYTNEQIARLKEIKAT